MKKISLMFLMVLVIIVLLGSNVLAYLDPGTGGVILNSIWPLIVVVSSAIGAFIVKWFWRPIKKSFLKLISKTKKE